MDNALFLVVQEFYASPRYHEPRNTEGHIWDTILVRRKENICRDIDMDNIINFVTEGRGEWKYRVDMFGLTRMEQEEEEPESEAKGEKEEDDRDEEIDDVEDD
ncbi:hypothetical protein Golax_025342 [Gossypium laxum]|uniref:Uncharacterized protein n=1 Tax=Gossypium laxum TaxID=34288 RepID=A0A7J9B5U4_9ROSI|nr:hypothetical protein [Gossypium laxum]